MVFCFLVFCFFFGCFLMKYMGALSEGAWATVRRSKDIEIKAV